MIQVRKPKLIFDPILGLIDATKVLPLIDVPEFQSLGFKYQLGLNSMIFPAATHTRKQHSLGAYERTKRLTYDWVHHGFIKEDEAFSLQVYALYHDIGHGPFSHVTERLGKIDHDTRGLQIIESLKDNISEVGCNYHHIHDYFSRKNPLYLAVFDKNLGMEKLDYLERDAFYTLGERPGVEFLAKHTYFVDGKVVIDEVAIDQAKSTQDFYIKMSKNVYLRKKSSILQRLIEKMTHKLMEEGLGEEELFELTDSGLLGKFELSKNKLVNFYFNKFIKGIYPKLTLEFKYQSLYADSDFKGKTIKAMGLDHEVLDALINSPYMNDLGELEKLEEKIAELTGIPKEAIVMLPPFSKNRFEPQDINVYTREGKIRLISQIYPNHFEAMKEYGRSHLSLRIGVFNEYRKSLYDQSEKIKNHLISLVPGH
ncbi:MAG: HD domain-containing protein [Patescibacteria group bacterium]